jgi:hypothetical protein
MSRKTPGWLNLVVYAAVVISAAAGAGSAASGGSCVELRA